MRSGYPHVGNGRILDAGNNVYGWSCISQSTINAYRLYTYPSNIYPSHYGDCWNGFILCGYTIIHVPLAFVRSGFIHLDNGRSYYIGYDSYGWSCVSRSVNVYRLYVVPTDAMSLLSET